MRAKLPDDWPRWVSLVLRPMRPVTRRNAILSVWATFGFTALVLARLVSWVEKGWATEWIWVVGVGLLAISAVGVWLLAAMKWVDQTSAWPGLSDLHTEDV